jgi:biopolymer transport protein ExbB
LTALVVSVQLVPVLVVVGKTARLIQEKGVVKMQSWLAFLDKAGPVGLIIVGTSVVALFIVLDRLWTYRRLRIRDPRSLHRLRKRAREGSFGQAVEEVAGGGHPLVRVLVEVLGRLKDGQRPATRGDLEKTIGHVGSREIRSLERFLPTLFLISNIAPLLGLFGTVTGMIKAFQAIQHLGGKVNASVLAGGIWEAMLTTALGLGVAIPAMVAHNFLEGKVHQAVADLKEESGLLLDALEDAGCLGNATGARLTPVHKGVPAGQENA